MEETKTSSAENVADTSQPDANDTAVGDHLNADSDTLWRARIAKSRQKRKELVDDSWSWSVDFRRGKPFEQESDTDRVNVNIDWPMVKAKHAQLFSAVPQVFLTAKRQQFKAAMAPFSKELNNRLNETDWGSAVDESVIDAINASGIGVAIVGYKTIQEMKPSPVIDAESMQVMAAEQPEQLQAMQTEWATKYPDPKQWQDGVPVEMVPDVYDTMYYVDRISPSDFLWPDDFERSNFDKAPWLGRTGRMYWSEAKKEFKLSEDQKEQVLGARGKPENLRGDQDNRSTVDDPVVEFDELFYWAYLFDADCKYFKQINRIVFVEGLKKPVIKEPWKAQVFNDQSRQYGGVCRFPIRVLTFTYISDDAIPPSDSAIIRPQVNELIEGRTQMMLQRRRAMPIRWFNSDRMDMMIGERLMQGEYQDWIPVQGDGTKMIGEVARPSYPSDDLRFDQIIKADISEMTQVSANQVGAFQPGERSAREAGIVQHNFETRISYERSRVEKFVVGIAEVMAGMLSLNSKTQYLDDQEIQRLEQSWNPKQLAGEYVYYIRPDSTVLLSAEQRIERIMKYLNLVGKSGYVNPKPLIEELTELHGIDPALVIVDPQPPRPEQPKITFSFRGEDLQSAMVLALLMQSGQAPTPELLTKAMNLLHATLGGMPDPNAPQGVPQANSGSPNGMPIGQLPPTDARPDWTPMPRVTKRVDEMGG